MWLKCPRCYGILADWPHNATIDGVPVHKRCARLAKIAEYDEVPFDDRALSRLRWRQYTGRTMPDVRR